MKSVLIALDHHGLMRCPVPGLIVSEHSDEDDGDSLDADQFLRDLSGNDIHIIS